MRQAHKARARRRGFTGRDLQENLATCDNRRDNANARQAADVHGLANSVARRNSYVAAIDAMCDSLNSNEKGAAVPEAVKGRRHSRSASFLSWTSQRR